MYRIIDKKRAEELYNEGFDIYVSSKKNDKNPTPMGHVEDFMCKKNKSDGASFNDICEANVTFRANIFNISENNAKKILAGTYQKTCAGA